MRHILSALAVCACATVCASASDIVDTAVSAGSFNTLVTAVKAAGLVDTLKGAGPFTVFAPTDEAFAKLPAGTLDYLLKNPETLKKILTYHVVSGKVMAADAMKMDGQSASTVEGSPLTIMVHGDTVMVGSANVVKTDVECDNGVIHVIDSVILPPDVKLPKANAKKTNKGGMGA